MIIDNYYYFTLNLKTETLDMICIIWKLMRLDMHLICFNWQYAEKYI